MVSPEHLNGYKKMKSDISRIFPGKTGLALGSGSARGWAHIGVIRALAETGVHVDFIAGTSIGALVGAIFASGEINSLEETVLRIDWMQIASFIDMVLPKSGLIDGKKITSFIRSQVKETNIEDLPIPFCAISTDLYTGREIIIREGDIIEAVRASFSIPGIFTPVKKNNMILLDGGLVNPVPVSAVRNMGADSIIAVDLSHDIICKKAPNNNGITDSGMTKPDGKNNKAFIQWNRMLDGLNNKFRSVDFPALTQVKQWMTKDPLPNIFEILVTSINIMESQITATQLKTDPPDLLIRPRLGHIKFLEFNRAQEAISEGYRETRYLLESLLQKGV